MLTSLIGNCKQLHIKLFAHPREVFQLASANPILRFHNLLPDDRKVAQGRCPELPSRFCPRQNQCQTAAVFTNPLPTPENILSRGFAVLKTRSASVTISATEATMM
jgi:hypothetical protein